MNLFNKTIRSNSLQKRADLKPLILKTSQKIIFDKIEIFLKENGFGSISKSEEFHEVFAIRNNLEYTFMIFQEGVNLTLSVMVYDEKHLFGKKAKLASILNELKIYFANYIK